MIKVEETEIWGWEHAIRGARNPLDSWGRSDSGEDENGDFVIGHQDKQLMTNLARAGRDHGKFLRMVMVSCDITAPLYWWKQFDTYRVGVEKNSCSTMHRIHVNPITTQDFSTDGMSEDGFSTLVDIVSDLERLRKSYNTTKDPETWRTLIQLMPNCYNQRRTVQMSYAAIRDMYYARKNHKLKEWREFCAWVESLPMFLDVIGEFDA